MDIDVSGLGQFIYNDDLLNFILAKHTHSESEVITTVTIRCRNSDSFDTWPMLEGVEGRDI